MTRYIGLDLGSKTLGVSISDGLLMIASTYETFRFEEDNYMLAANRVKEIVLKEKISKVILGMPKHMNGDIGIRGKISEEFKVMIQSLVDVEVILEDERLTTAFVNKIMISGNTNRKKRKEKKDEMAAVVILQNYLDRKVY